MVHGTLSLFWRLITTIDDHDRQQKHNIGSESKGSSSPTFNNNKNNNKTVFI